MVPSHLKISAAIFFILVLTLLSNIPYTQATPSASYELVRKTRMHTVQQRLLTLRVVLSPSPAPDTEPAHQIDSPLIVQQKAVLPTPTPQSLPSEWGISKQIDEHTWTIGVGNDARSAGAQEIFAALNAYRQKKGAGTLAWDSKLASYAQERTVLFQQQGKLDTHAGFQDYINNQDGFNKLGFYGLGENSSFGYQLEGVHLIEWVYAGDKPHDDNQLNAQWSHVGIGVAGTATNLIFGGNKQ